MNIRFDIDFSELENLFSEAELRQALDAAIKETVRRVDLHFEKRQSSWAALDKETILQKVALGLPSGKKLIASGNLRANATNDVTVSSSTEFEIGTTVPYASYLQSGTKDTPARPFLDLSPDDYDAILDAYLDVLFS